VIEVEPPSVGAGLSSAIVCAVLVPSADHGSDGVSLDLPPPPGQECRTRGGHTGHGFHGAVGLRGRTADEVEQALRRSTVELGWMSDPRGEIDLQVVDAGDSLWVSAATAAIVPLAEGLARALGRAVRLYTVEVDGGTIRCGGRSVRPDGGADPLDGTGDDDVIDVADSSPLELAEERLRVLLDANEDIDPDRSRTLRRFAVRPPG
jgi:hypothetical protein